MLHNIWSFMILAGMLWGAANGNLSAVTQSLIDSVVLFCKMAEWLYQILIPLVVCYMIGFGILSGRPVFISQEIV